MRKLYQSTFTSVGPFAAELLEDNFLITFGEGNLHCVVEYCFIHTVEINQPESMQPDDLIKIDTTLYLITAIGSLAREHLHNLGHITLRFDGAQEPLFPGSIHVSGSAPVAIEVGQKFLVLSDSLK